MTARIAGNALIICLFSLATPVFSAPTIEQLVAHPTIADIKISPTGDYLAVRVFTGEKHVLQFLRRDNMEIIDGFGLPQNNEIGDYHWASNERVVGQVMYVFPGKRQPAFLGEIFATNYDGKHQEILFGVRSGEKQVGSHIRKKDSDRAWATLIDPLPEDDEHILIASEPYSKAQRMRHEVMLLDLYSGLERRQGIRSRYGKATFLTDQSGKVRAITSLRDDYTLHLQTLPPGTEDWVDVSPDRYGAEVDIVAVSDDGEYLYVVDDKMGDRQGLYKISLDGTRLEKVYEHDVVDISDLNMSTDGRAVYAMRVDNGYPSYLIFSKSHDEAAVFRQLLATFPGNLVSIRSRSRDGKYWIVKTGTDTDGGTFYLYDHEESEVRALFRVRPEVDPQQLAPMEPIEFESFDGEKIHGYFTRGISDLDTPPMVVRIHGGPKARDRWGYDSVVQVLATRGYSVLQINYRGSTGYGKRFAAIGQRHWGDDVQRDIIEGTKWAIKTGRANAGEVCIMGASYGAYSAVQSATIEPDLYQCVVANAGIYDLPLLYSHGDIEDLYFGEAYLRREIGTNENELAAFSPVNNVSKLKAPIFIAHGKRDERAPFKHAKELRKALRKHEKAFEWFVKGDEAHGFYDTSNQVEYLGAALKFLDKHLK